MTDQWNYGPGVQDPASAAGGQPDGSSRDDRWLRRPRRSSGDRKIAGVAGGLGRAFGIDPVLIRVAFVVLTIFGGFGGLLYVLGWLLLPSDGDEVSAAEALLGRGRSSVPPVLAVGLGVVAVISLFSMFSWGLPFLPLAIGGVVVLAIMRRRGRFDSRGHWTRGEYPAGGPRTDWMRRTDEQVRNWTEQVEGWAAGARRAGRDARQHRGGWSGFGWPGCGSHGPGAQGGWNWPRGGWAGGSSSTAAGNSPFEQPAFWDQPSAGDRVDGPSPAAAAERVDMTKPQPAAGTTPPVADMASPTEARTTPPAWDPLGVAPFAWDLPEPTPLPQTTPVTTRTPGVVGRVAIGTTLLVGGLAAVGVFAGWWTLTWAQVAGISLAVLALGLLVASLRGRGYSLIGPGIFLSLVTVALAVTGINGTSGYGDATIVPASLSELQPSYSSNAGDLTLDLRGITVPKGQTRTVDVDLKAGRALIQVPAATNVTAACQAHVGQVDCLGQTADGVRKSGSGTISGNAESGTLNIDVTVNAGLAQVQSDD